MVSNLAIHKLLGAIVGDKRHHNASYKCRLAWTTAPSWCGSSSLQAQLQTRLDQTKKKKAR